MTWAAAEAIESMNLRRSYQYFTPQGRNHRTTHIYMVSSWNYHLNNVSTCWAFEYITYIFDLECTFRTKADSAKGEQYIVSKRSTTKCEIQNPQKHNEGNNEWNYLLEASTCKIDLVGGNTHTSVHERWNLQEAYCKRGRISFLEGGRRRHL